MSHQTSPRRQFLSDTFTAVSSFGAAGALSALGCRVSADDKVHQNVKLKPATDQTTGIPLLRLPEGFTYRSFGWSGDAMSDGTKTPVAHDGMAVIAENENLLTIARNHEVSSDGPSLKIKNGSPYDPQARGGCTHLIFDTSKGDFVKSYVSLAGTSRNCAGGVTPWGYLADMRRNRGGLGRHRYVQK